jgi:hypothetical protein
MDNGSKWVDSKSSILGNIVEGANRYAQDVSSIQKFTENAGKDLKAIEESDF